MSSFSQARTDRNGNKGSVNGVPALSCRQFLSSRAGAAAAMQLGRTAFAGSDAAPAARVRSRALSRRPWFDADRRRAQRVSQFRHGSNRLQAHRGPNLQLRLPQMGGEEFQRRGRVPGKLAGERESGRPQGRIQLRAAERHGRAPSQETPLPVGDGNGAIQLEPRGRWHIRELTRGHSARRCRAAHLRQRSYPPLPPSGQREVAHPITARAPYRFCSSRGRWGKYSLRSAALGVTSAGRIR